MKNYVSVSRLAFQLLGAVALLASGILHAEPVNATVHSVVGTAYSISPSGAQHQIVVGEVIPSGNAIQTGADGTVGLQLVPGATTVVAPGTHVSVKSLDFSKSSDGLKQRKITLNLTKGTIFNSLAKKDGNSSFKIITPHGVAAARGTDWSVTVSDTGTVSVDTVTGNVTFTAPGAAPVDCGANAHYDAATGTITGLTKAQVDAIVGAITGAGFTTSGPVTGGNATTTTTTTTYSNGNSSANPATVTVKQEQSPSGDATPKKSTPPVDN